MRRLVRIWFAFGSGLVRLRTDRPRFQPFLTGQSAIRKGGGEMAVNSQPLRPGGSPEKSQRAPPALSSNTAYRREDKGIRVLRQRRQIVTERANFGTGSCVL
jgi:hypothetical protein